MPDVTRPCAKCGRVFTSTYRTRPPAYCSNECRYVDRVECAACGELFGRDRQAVRRGAKYCSITCVGVGLERRSEITCYACGKTIKRKKSQVRAASMHFCSRSCANRSRPHIARTRRDAKTAERKAPRSLVYIRPCDVCGELFAAKSRSAKMCSDRCRLDAIGKRVTDLYALATQFSDGRYTGGTWRQMLLRYLVDRDGDKCSICRRKVDISLKSGVKGSHRGPSIDHIVPRSKGGSDDPANLRLTHWGCNRRRGNRGGNEQLMLVG